MQRDGDAVKVATARAAQGDVWEAIGRSAVERGKGLERLAGIRLTASGLPHPQWNNGDVTDGPAVEIDRVTAWSASRDLSFGVRVPAGAPWPYGRRLLGMRLIAIDAGDLVAGPGSTAWASAQRSRPTPTPSGHRRGCVRGSRRRRAAMPGAAAGRQLEHRCARRARRPTGGNRVHGGTDDDAGPALYVAGIAVVSSAWRRGVGGALSAWLVGRRTDRGACIAHLNPDSDEAAQIDARLGVVEMPGYDVYVDDAVPGPS